MIELLIGQRAHSSPRLGPGYESWLLGYRIPPCNLKLSLSRHTYSCEVPSIFSWDLILSPVFASGYLFPQSQQLIRWEDYTWSSWWAWEHALFNMSWGLAGLEFVNEEFSCHLTGSPELLKAFDESWALGRCIWQPLRDELEPAEAAGEEPATFIPVQVRWCAR